MSRGNVFLIVNLGCEMMYVIDQRLKAQCICLEKSTQVLRDLTCVLLDPKFLDQLMYRPATSPIGSGSIIISKVESDDHAKLLTPQHCRILLSDIACCSLMRLDTNSMDKLWDLMTMILKWQLYSAENDQNPEHLLNITLRHMDGIGRLIPEMRKTLLIDCAKRYLIEFWDEMGTDGQLSTYQDLLKWLKDFQMKISILIRFGFQRTDGTFETIDKIMANEQYRYYVDNVGENIYSKQANVSKKSLHLKTKSTNETKGHGQRKINEITALNNANQEINALINQLNIQHSSVDVEPYLVVNSLSSSILKNQLHQNEVEPKDSITVHNNFLKTESNVEIDKNIITDHYVEMDNVIVNENSIVHSSSFDQILNGIRIGDRSVATVEEEISGATAKLLKMLDPK